MIDSLAARLSIRRRFRVKGYTLVEIILVLLILGILVPSFLGIFSVLAQQNRESRLIMTAGNITENTYEKAKGMSVPQLSELAASGETTENNMLLKVEAERFKTDEMSLLANYIDIVVKDDPSNSTGFISYAYGDSIQELISITGQGQLTIHIKPEKEYTDVCLTDSSGRYAEYSFSANKSKLIMNINALKMSNGKQVKVIIGNHPESNLEISIHEPPMHSGIISVHFNGQILYTGQIIKPVHSNNITVFSRKTETAISTPIYLRVEAYRQEPDIKLLSCRQGLIMVKP